METHTLSSPVHLTALARDIAWQLARSLDVPGATPQDATPAGDVRLAQDTLSTEHSNSRFDPPINRRSFSGARAQRHPIYLHSSDLRGLAAASSKAQTCREQGRLPGFVVRSAEPSYQTLSPWENGHAQSHDELHFAWSAGT
ncbi:hypothetical protein DTO271G3_5926 [Paecilomyces variotii]|nr:hypothetical protein DTO271G3_5926 [Paecilomyces variotii]